MNPGGAGGRWRTATTIDGGRRRQRDPGKDTLERGAHALDAGGYLAQARVADVADDTDMR